MHRFLVLLASLLAISLALQCYDAGDKLINQRCFKLVNQKLSFADARNWCHYHNPVSPSYLAVVTDQTTTTFLASYARTSFNVNEGPFWIGLSRANSTSKFYWDNEQQLVWSNFELQTAQNYVAESVSNGKWTTYSGDTKMNFVCSYDPNAPPTFSPSTGSTPPMTDATETIDSSTPYTAAGGTTGWSDVTPTPTDVPRCIPTGQTTFLFGYSTELDPNVVKQVKDQIVQALTANPRTNVKFGDVRFDCNNGSVIYYHDDIASFSASVDAHLPDESLVFPVYENETDVFPILNSFLTNPNIPVCGSTTFFLIKRLCHTCDTWQATTPNFIFQRVTANHIQSNWIPNGGALVSFLLSDYTNGLIVNAGQYWPEDDSSFPSVAEKMMRAPYGDNLLYPEYIGQPSIANITGQQLGALRVPMYSDSMVNVTLVITTDVFDVVYFQSIRLTFVDRATQEKTTLFYDRTDLFSDTDSIWKTIQLKSGSTSDVYMDYQTDFVGNVQIRMYIDKPVPDNWVSPPVIHYNSRPVLRVEPKF